MERNSLLACALFVACAVLAMGAVGAGDAASAPDGAVRTCLALGHRAYRSLIVGGGVSLNGRLRAKLAEVAAEAGVRLTRRASEEV